MSAISAKTTLANWSAKTIYTVPPDKVSTVTLNLCNFTDNTVEVYVIINAGNNYTSDDWLEHKTIIPPHGVLERTGIVLNTGEQLRAWDNAAGIAARVHGFEEDN